MLNDILVVGTSIASGTGKGKEPNTPDPHAVKSWVNVLAEKSYARNVWNHSLPGKPLGLVNADAVEFGKQYWDKYRSYENLFVILEYSLPSFRHWDPVASARSDCVQMNIVPITYFAPFTTLEEATQEKYYRGNSLLKKKFYSRETHDMLAHNPNTHHIYEEIEEEEIKPEDLKRFEQQAVDWFTPSEENKLRYLRYAFDEILATQKYCEDKNIAYMQTWVGGVTDAYKRGVDRFMKPLMTTNRLVPMTEFTAASATMEWSEKPWRNHPDKIGHRRIGEFYHDWINKYKLFERPNNTLYTGFSEGF